MRRLYKLGMFALLPLVSAVAPFLALPAVTAKFGAPGWAAIAIGTSVGAALSVLVELGWGLNGPARVARASLKASRRIYALSLLTKSVAFLPSAALAALLAAVVARDFIAESALAAVAGTSLGFSAMWFFIGRGQPQAILLSDALPKVVFSVGAAFAIESGGPLYIYPASQLAAALVSPIAGALLMRATSRDFSAFGRRRVFRSIYYQSMALGGRASSALYIALPVVIVGGVSPSSVAVFSAAERLERMTLSFLQSVPNVILPWVARASTPGTRRSRTIKSLQLNAFLGLAAGLVFILLAPLASELLFSGQATVSPQLAAICAGVIAVSCTSRASGGIGLVSYGRIRPITTSATAGALIGIPAIALLAGFFGEYGGFFGELIAEMAVLSVQLFALLRVMRKR